MTPDEVESAQRYGICHICGGPRYSVLTGDTFEIVCKQGHALCLCSTSAEPVICDGGCGLESCPKQPCGHPKTDETSADGYTFCAVCSVQALGWAARFGVTRWNHPREES